jgi:hypothetical protein
MGIKNRLNELLGGASKGEKKGSLEEQLKGSVNKDELLKNIKRNNSREILSDADLNKLVELEDNACFSYYNFNTNERRESLKGIESRIVRKDEQDEQIEKEIAKSSETKPPKKVEKDRDLEL